MITRTFADLTPIEQELADAAVKIRERAYTVVTGFQVGAALLTSRFKDGSTFEPRIFTGCNVENCVLLANHAEEVAIVSMIKECGCKPHGPPMVEIMAVALCLLDDSGHALPCGSCCQRIAEFADVSTSILGVRVDKQGRIIEIEYTTIGELLPYAFSSRNLGW